MDEQPVPLHRKPGRQGRQRSQRVDDEDERCQTACVFTFIESLAGWLAGVTSGFVSEQQ
jgi:hypothetical protein